MGIPDENMELVSHKLNFSRLRKGEHGMWSHETITDEEKIH